MIVAVLLGIVLARSVLEPNARLSNEFAVIGAASPSDLIELGFAMKVSPSARAALEHTLLQVSDPRLPTYGDYLEPEEITEILAVPESAFAQLNNYLASEGITSETGRELYGMILSVTVNVSDAERLLQAKISRFCHKKHERYCLLRARSYTVDDRIAPLIDFVSGVLHFPSLDRFTQRVQAKQNPAQRSKRQTVGWTPRSLRDLFNTDSAYPISGTNNTQAVASFLGQYYDEPDLQEFFGLFYQEGVGTTPSNVIGDQGLLPGVEANLDVQYIMATSGLVNTWVYSNQGLHDGQEPFLKWLSILGNTSNAQIPKTISVSYGDDENSIQSSYLVLCNTAFQALGTRGVSVMFASGDSGASCTDKGTRFSPGWPATSPWVTAVGGVVGDTGSLEADSISGGGFSNFFSVPDYQTSAVQAYLAAAQQANVLPPASFYNASGRAFPDVAAPSEGFWVVSYLVPSPVAGTSCASPSFTTVISLLNEVQLSKNNPTLGFLNLWLYQNAASMMQPVNSGCNVGCPKTKDTGFCAVSGQGIYSPVAGLGVPDYNLMLQFLPQKN
jgi:tripeptidyl-peptidase-1